MKSILDRGFKYVPAAFTDIRETFRRVRAEQAAAAGKGGHVGTAGPESKGRKTGVTTLLPMIAAAVLLAPSSDGSADVFVRNKSGGAIVLSDLPCLFDGMAGDHLAYHFSSTAFGEWGCWGAQGDDSVAVQWQSDSAVIIYGKHLFSPVPERPTPHEGGRSLIRT